MTIIFSLRVAKSLTMFLLYHLNLIYVLIIIILATSQYGLDALAQLEEQYGFARQSMTRRNLK